MTTTPFSLKGGDLRQTWTNATFASNNDWSAIASIVGYRGDGLASASGASNAGAVVADYSTAIPAVLSMIVTPVPTTSTGTGGVAYFPTLTDPTVALQGSGTARAPNLVIYLDSTGMQNVHLTLDVRDVDPTADNAIQQVAIQYRIGDSGVWTNINPAGTIPPAAAPLIADATEASLASKSTPVDVTLPAIANDKALVEIRILTVDASGNDEWVGIDNIVVTAKPLGDDLTAPTISTSLPADNATNIAANADLTITFNEAIAVGSGNITLTNGAGDVRTIAVTDSTQVSITGSVMKINPTADLNLNTTYHLTLPDGAVLDLSGNKFAGNASNPIDFTTAQPGDTTPPVIASASPIDGATNVAADAALTVTFNEAVTRGSGNITLTDGAGDVRTIDITDTSQVSLSGTVMTIHPTAALNLSSTYHLTLPVGAVLDTAGNAFAGNASNPVDFATALKLTPIYDIQGAAHTSPLLGQTVHTTGIITAKDTTSTVGFYLQDPTGDGNNATSDAVFVASTAAAMANLAIGDKVDLQAVVAEVTGAGGVVANNLTITELTSVQNLTVISRGNEIVPTIIGAGGRVAPGEVADSDHFAVFNPSHDAIDFYESVEGMLLTIKNVQVVNNSVSGATFVIPDNGTSSSGANDRGGLTNALGDVSPERFQIFADVGVKAGIQGLYTIGDKIGDVTGVMSYYGANYELLPTVLPAAATANPASRETATLSGDATHLSVAAYNLNSLGFDDNQTKYDALAVDIVNRLGKPDLVGLEGVQDSNGNLTGALDADLTIGRLLDAIVAAGGPRYQFAQVDPSDENSTGGALNTNERSVVLFNPNHVQYVEESARLLDDSTPVNGNSFAGAVHPLAADFVFRGETITYIVVDNVSRGVADELFGKNQPGNIGNEALRADQIASVQDFVAELQQANPGHHVVVGGNFNAYQFESAMTALASGAGLTNLTDTLVASDRYTSAFEGNNTQLDHVLVSGDLAGGAKFDIVHFNTNLASNIITQTDRDPVLATVYINSAPAAVADSFDVKEDTTLTANALQGVLANDKDVNPDTLTASLVSGTAHGNLLLNADGSFSYTPQANYNGADSFSYKVNDGHGADSAVATVQLTVAAVNDGPSLTADAPSAVLIEDGQNGAGIDVSSVQLHASDFDSATLVIGNDGWIAQGDGLFSQDGVYGTATLDTIANTVTYQLDNGLGDTDSLAAGALVHEHFTVTLSDGANAVSVPVTFDIQGANDSPYGKGDHATAVEDASVLVNVLANDGDADGDTLGIVLDSAKSSLGATLTLENGQVRYSADADAFDMMATNTSVTDRFTYHIADGHGGLSGPISAQVTVQEAGDNVSLVGTAGNDTFRAVLGKDTTYDGGAGNDKIFGAAGADTLLGGDGIDAIDGGAGNDNISGGAGNDNLLGGDGDDSLDGGSGNDSLSGGNGNDRMDGGIGDDLLQGGAGIDHLIGNTGNDALVGGTGNDLLEGGSGTDLFAFGAQAGRDTIADFTPGEDVILTGYADGGSLGSAATWNTTLRNSAVPTPATAWSFTNFDADANGSADSVLISGGTLGADTSIVLTGWSIATLVGNHYLNAQGTQAIGGWLH